MEAVCVITCKMCGEDQAVDQPLIQRGRPRQCYSHHHPKGEPFAVALPVGRSVVSTAVIVVVTLVAGNVNFKPLIVMGAAP